MPVKQRRASLEKIMLDYAKICKQEAAKAGVAPKQKSAWNLLAGTVEGWRELVK
jgi:hypothetical protein